jgi:hypothetical protein
MFGLYNSFPSALPLIQVEIDQHQSKFTKMIKVAFSDFQK